MEIQMGGGGGGSLNLEILRGGGLKQFWKSKNRAFRHGGVDFFWNNPIQMFFSNILGSKIGAQQ